MAGIIGVRFERAGRVSYFAAVEPLAVGDRVVLAVPGGVRYGWVVIAPDQVVLDELPERPTIVARRVERPAEAGAGGEANAGHFGLAAALISPAQAPPLSPELEATAGLVARLAAALSPRNRDYVEQKLRLPALGEQVETAQGPGRVVAVNVLRERVTVALESGGEVVLGGPGLEPVPPEEAPPRGERRGRRGRRRERPTSAERGSGPAAGGGDGAEQG
ncbi:MAG TPA: hypothetical protein VII06_06525 [Chloroflexota bacterium]|jgi:hypothetical protein